MNGHIVLLGDSIFDNAVYVPSGASVLEHLRYILPLDWVVTSLAVDGARMSSVECQLQQLPDDTTHLFLSVGSNDVLDHVHILNQSTDFQVSALTTIDRIRAGFSAEYRHMLDQVCAIRLPLAVCTIYDSIPTLTPPESAALSVFNEAITKQVFATGSTLIDLRLICGEASDYASMPPIEPSASGGKKIARAIYRTLFDSKITCRVVV